MSPTRPQRQCTWAGCTNLTGERWCARHRTEAARQDRAMRGTEIERGYGAEHERWRDQVLARDRWCRDPERRHPGEPRPATVADHVVPITRGGARFDLANGQGLCSACHNAKTARERAT